MTINEATKLALQFGGTMTRFDGPTDCCFEPTNTDDGIIIHGPDGMKPGVRWNPSADDLTSDLWVVTYQDEDGNTVMQFQP